MNPNKDELRRWQRWRKMRTETERDSRKKKIEQIKIGFAQNKFQLIYSDSLKKSLLSSLSSVIESYGRLAHRLSLYSLRFYFSFLFTKNFNFKFFMISHRFTNFFFSFFVLLNFTSRRSNSKIGFGFHIDQYGIRIHGLGHLLPINIHQ